ncbi:MAG: nucleoside triphosphate pyrophosphohydrolase [Candidatus Zixiibacteriota bacterium]|nr:MAG: nucleoside triphosphate pyrophosphohydrolase [candidate division Zixibacteria bacterium]
MNNFERLVEIMAKLRGPEGCPWDKEQDHKSLKPYLIEEAYEVLEAIETGNDSKFAEELGDLLSQVVMHAQLAKEREVFDIDIVARKISEKLIERHPHVFGNKKGLTSREVLHNWEIIKSKQATNNDYSILQGLPKSLPALLKAFRIQEKVGRYGFDWDNILDVVNKVKEEFSEFESALKNNEDKSELENEFGDLLFALVNLGRHLDLQAEQSLNTTITKFMKRFRYIEDRLRGMGKTVSESNLEEMDRLWDESKKESDLQ